MIKEKVIGIDLGGTFIKGGLVNESGNTEYFTKVPTPISRKVEEVVDAIRLATINPAKNIGMDTRKGSIELGKDADFAVLNNDLDVIMTIRGGNVIYDVR